MFKDLRNYPYFFLLLGTVLLYSRTYSEAQTSPITMLNIHRVLGILFSISLSFFFILKHGGFVKTLPKTLKAYGLYIATGFVSSLLFSSWILFSLWKLTEIFSVFVFGIYLLILPNLHLWIRKFLRITIIFYNILLILSVIGIALHPNKALVKLAHRSLLPYRLEGSIVIINGNTLGLIAAIVFVYYLEHSFTANVQPITRLFWLGLSLGVLILTQARASIIATFLIIFLYIRKLRIEKALKVFIVLVMVLVVGLSEPFVYKFLQRGQTEESLHTLSGRTLTWKFALKKFKEQSNFRKLIGGGYATFNREILLLLGRKMSGTVDNEYLNSLLSAGIVGFLAIVYIFSQLIITSIKVYKRNPESYVYFAISFLFFIRSFTNTHIALFTSLSPIFPLLSAYYGKALWRRTKY